MRLEKVKTSRMAVLRHHNQIMASKRTRIIPPYLKWFFRKVRVNSLLLSEIGILETIVVLTQSFKAELFSK